MDRFKYDTEISLSACSLHSLLFTKTFDDFIFSNQELGYIEELFVTKSDQTIERQVRVYPNAGKLIGWVQSFLKKFFGNEAMSYLTIQKKSLHPGNEGEYVTTFENQIPQLSSELKMNGYVQVEPIDEERCKMEMNVWVKLDKWWRKPIIFILENEVKNAVLRMPGVVEAWKDEQKK